MENCDICNGPLVTIEIENGEESCRDCRTVDAGGFSVLFPTHTQQLAQFRRIADRYERNGNTVAAQQWRAHADKVESWHK